MYEFIYILIYAEMAIICRHSHGDFQSSIRVLISGTLWNPGPVKQRQTAHEVTLHLKLLTFSVENFFANRLGFFPFTVLNVYKADGISSSINTLVKLRPVV